MTVRRWPGGFTPFQPGHRPFSLEYSDIAATPGIERSLAHSDGLHYLNAPNHGIEVLDQLEGELRSLRKKNHGDPLLWAYEIRDAKARIAGLVIDLDKWSHAVIECNDPDLPHTGAH